MMAEDFSAHAAKVHVDFSEDQTPERMRAYVEGLMSRITLDCVAAGTRLIGHVKCIAEIEPERYVACSVTGHDGKARCSGEFGRSSDHLSLIINILQYGLTKETLEGIVLKEAPSAFGDRAKVVVEDLTKTSSCETPRPIRLE